ncbi:MAG: RNA polymerase Rpb4 family protein [Candidatus Aenigmatarchaeota archaeon]|nr:RNA polymerase Rpb4 family protein [Candidatus Aenigmarchaeota archaeon]
MKIIEAKPITMGEAKEIMTKVEKNKKELTYEQKLALEHLKKFTKLNEAESIKLLEEINSFIRLSPEIAIQIVNILPKSPDELRLITSRESFILKEEEITKILEIIKKYI